MSTHNLLHLNFIIFYPFPFMLVVSWVKVLGVVDVYLVRGWVGCGLGWVIGSRGW